MALLTINHLQIGFAGADPLVHEVAFQVEAGETLAIVGESGSGKSISLLAVLGLLPASAQVSGDIQFAGQALLGLSPERLRALRGARIGYISQDPLSNLHPLKSIGDQIAEAIVAHQPLRRSAVKQRVLALLEEVGIHNAAQRYHDRPAKFSGGMRQRVMIAIAIALNPALIIADEPTTALDVTVQASILQLLKRLQQQHGCALIFISHDLRVVADIADRVVVMQHGRVVEQGPWQQLRDHPQQAYTRALLNAAWQPLALGQRQTLAGPPLLQVNKVARSFRQARLWPLPTRHNPVLQDIGFQLQRGEILGLVGESGSGKTTLGRIIAGLETADAGTLHLDQQLWQQGGGRLPAANHAARFAVQVVFQDPYSSLNPRRRIGDILAEPLQLAAQREDNHSLNAAQLQQAIAELLTTVELSPQLASRYASQLSGGQRQRVAIARALAMRPQLIIADEAVSALDITTQQLIVHLLARLRDQQGLSVLFISHDLSVVAALCDRILVLQQGHIVEQGSSQQIFSQPQHPYTQQLLRAIPGQGQLQSVPVSEIPL